MTRKPMKKTRHDKNLRIEHEGQVWHVDAAEWRGDDGKGELRIYAVHGDVVTLLLAEALELEAASRGLDFVDLGRPPETKKGKS